MVEIKKNDFMTAFFGFYINTLFLMVSFILMFKGQRGLGLLFFILSYAGTCFFSEIILNMIQFDKYKPGG